MTDQVVMSRTPGSFGTVLAPRGSSNPSGWRVESAASEREFAAAIMAKSTNEVIHECNVGRDPA
jgi:hypothetical protein